MFLNQLINTLKFKLPQLLLSFKTTGTKLLRIFVITIITLICGTSSLVYLFNQLNHSTEVTSYNKSFNQSFIIVTLSDNTQLKLEVANNQEARQQGLMYRTSLDQSDGMLFVFEELQQLTFWMKNTYISLDIIFLDQNHKVLTIHQNTKPNQTGELYPSTQPAMFAIELSAGSVSELNIQTDDILYF